MDSFEEVSLSAGSLDPADICLGTRLFRSRASGLQVCLADVPGPLINVYSTLRTESHDSRGLPHSLEHLIFLGSERYPYRGILDQLSNLAFADGTNAWTAQDHTTYTLTCGSKNGLQTILPIYLDHIFFPLLEDPHFLTEVYAFDGQGDAGVVFCEMQGVERKLSTIAANAVSKLLWPGTNGYNVETGGLMEDLRSSSMNMEAIRKYHSAYYRPENAMIFICGSKLDPEVILTSIREMDFKLAQLPRGIERPFSQKIEPLVANSEAVVDYPNESEDFGRVELGFRMGSLKENRDMFTVLTVLADYLADGISAPLHVALVDLPEPYCRSVSFDFGICSELAFFIGLNGVPVARLAAAKEKVSSVLRDILEAGIIDASRMEAILRTKLEDETSAIETQPAETLQDNVGSAFLYFDMENDFLDVLWGERGRLRKLLKEKVSDSEFWLNVLRKHVVEADRVVVSCRPSKELHAKFASDDEERLKHRLEALGEEGIAQAAQAWTDALAAVDTVCPEDKMATLRKEIHSSVDTSTFHQLETWRLEKMPSFEKEGPAPWLNAHLHPLNALPFDLFQADHYSGTEFVDLGVSFNFHGGLSSKDLLFLELFTELLFSVPLSDITSHLDVAAAMRRDLLEESAGTGLQGSSYFSAGSWPTVVSLFCRSKSYEKAVSWMRRSFFDSHFDADRMRVALNALKSRLDDSKQSSGKMERSAVSNLLFKKGSVITASSLKKQKAFLKDFDRLLKKKPETAVSKFAAFVANLRAAAPIVHVVADFRCIVDPVGPWKPWFSKTKKQLVIDDLPVPSSALLKDNAFSKPKNILIKMPIDESYASFYWKAVSYDLDRDAIPAVFVLTSWLSMMESLLWKAVRGQGLAYGISVSMNIERGYIRLHISDSSSVSDLVEAMTVSKSIINTLDEHIDTVALASGRSLAICEVLTSLETHQSVAESRFRSLFRGYSPAWLLEQIDQVTVKDLHRAWKKYMLNMDSLLTVVVIPKGEAFEF